MIGNEHTFARYYPLFEYVFSVFIGADFLAFPYTSRHISASWQNIKSPLLLHRQS